MRSPTLGFLKAAGPLRPASNRCWAAVRLSNIEHQQKALLVCQTCFPDAQIVWMLALIASLKQGFSITAILAGYYNPATIPNPRNPPNPKISPLDDLAVRAPHRLCKREARFRSMDERLGHSHALFMCGELDSMV
jgi:hypothetical protein